MAKRHRSPVSRRDQLRRLAWASVEGVLFGPSFHTWNRWRAFLLRLFGARIGRRCTIRRTVRVYYPWLFSMDDDSVLGDRVVIYNLTDISLGQRVLISQEAYLCAGTHDYTRTEMPLVTRPIRVGDDAWICARAFIGPGLTINAGGIVAAAAVVVRDVEAWTIVGGNPACKVKNRPPFSSK